MNRRQRIKVALVLSLVASAAVAVEAPSAASAEGVRLRRAAELRQVLLDTIERTIADGRGWPDRLELRGGSRMLVYSKPKIVSKGRVVEDELGASVVLHEPIKAFPGGVWVGYADGHLEFAPDAAALAECMQQVSILHEAIAENPALFEDRPAHPEPRPPIAAPKGSLTVKVVDGDGRAVAGAMVGISSQRGDRFAGQVPIVYFPFVPDEDSTRVTDASGLATIPGPHVFEAARFVDSPTAPMYVLHEGRGLAALEEFTREEFGQEPGKAPERPREVRLRAACRITGELTSLGMRGSGRTQQRGYAFAFRPGKVQLAAQHCNSNGPTFDLVLPPGDFAIACRAADSYTSIRYVRIAEGRREIHLRIDVNPFVTGALLGQPAPELRSIKAWKNGGAVKLADLRGKVVLLDFWGTWCGPCLGAMPELMKLHDEYRAKGLVIVAVHDDSVASIAEMDQKLEKVRKNDWAGRDLPFLVALDGGGSTRIRGTSTTAAGATTAAYGIVQFPTALLIGRDGKVVGPVEVNDPDKRDENRKKIEAALSGARE